MLFSIVKTTREQLLSSQSLRTTSPMANNCPSGEKERQEIGFGLMFLLLLGVDSPKLEATDGSDRASGIKPASGLMFGLASGLFIHCEFRAVLGEPPREEVIPFCPAPSRLLLLKLYVPEPADPSRLDLFSVELQRRPTCLSSLWL